MTMYKLVNKYLLCCTYSHVQKKYFKKLRHVRAYWYKAMHRKTRLFQWFMAGEQSTGRGWGTGRRLKDEG